MTFFTINGSTQTNSFLGAMTICFFIYENIKTSFDTNVNNVTRITISSKNFLKIKYLLMKKSNFEHNLKALNNKISNLTYKIQE